MIPVYELPHTNVYLVRNQNYTGRSVVALKKHVRELFHLSLQEQAAFIAEVALVAKTLDELFAPDKLNYGIFGDIVPHLHCHIVPKYRDGFTWGSPFLLQGNDLFLSETDLAGRAESIRILLESHHLQEGSKGFAPQPIPKE